MYIPTDLLKESRPFLRVLHGDALHCSLEHQEVLGLHIDAQLLQLAQVV